VRRGYTSVYDRLWNQFRRSVDVMWDRREAERRRQARRVAGHHASGDRRQPVPETWRTLGFIVVTTRR